MLLESSADCGAPLYSAQLRSKLRETNAWVFARPESLWEAVTRPIGSWKMVETPEKLGGMNSLAGCCHEESTSLAYWKRSSPEQGEMTGSFGGSALGCFFVAACLGMAAGLLAAAAAAAAGGAAATFPDLLRLELFLSVSLVPRFVEPEELSPPAEEELGLEVCLRAGLPRFPELGRGAPPDAVASPSLEGTMLSTVRARCSG